MDIVKRFLEYTQFDTQSAEDSATTPSTEKQWKFARFLRDQLEEIGLSDVELDECGYIYATLPANTKKETPTIGFISHYDTSPDCSGADIKPRIVEKYDGGDIVLDAEADIVTSPAKFPELKAHVGEDIIVTDGHTLLGADDKAGIAEIVTAASWFMTHPEIKHNSMEIFITPDEELGRGTDLFPLSKIKSDYIYTVDGDTEGCIESECFNAYSAKLSIKGVSIHPGSGRGKLVNASLLGAKFLSMLPANEMPETSEGREGFFCPVSISGEIDQCQVALIIRDFETSGIERRIAVVESCAETLKKAYPSASFDLEISYSYSNMKEYIDKNKKCLEYLEEAVEKTGIKPVHKLIRGGTDGSRLSELGHPCPNIFTGGQNFHGNLEWAALPAMVRAVQVIINLVCTGIAQ